uniref:Smad nuclear-interacting protein 1 n=1 Tax=Culex pipiens TaxID=7175 RepID=A0A8D8GAR7_CULPI
MGKSKKKYESSSSSSSSDASESSDSSSSEDVEVKRRSRKSKKSGGGGRKHKKKHVSSGSDGDSGSDGEEESSSAKKKHKKHKKVKKVKKHKKHKSRADSDDEKRVEIVEEDEMEVVEEVVARRHRTTSSDDYVKARHYESSIHSRDSRREPVPKHPSSKWDSPADGGDYRGHRKRSPSPRVPQYDEYRGKAPRSPPPPVRGSPARGTSSRRGADDYQRGKSLHQGRGAEREPRAGGPRGYGDERRPVSPPMPPQERSWDRRGGDRFEEERNFRKPSPGQARRGGRFEQHDERGGGFDGGRHGSSGHQHRGSDRYEEFSGRDRAHRDHRSSRGSHREEYHHQEERGAAPRRRNSPPMGGGRGSPPVPPPSRDRRERSPAHGHHEPPPSHHGHGQHDFRGSGYRGGDRYDGGPPPAWMDRGGGGRFNRGRGGPFRGGRGGMERGGRRNFPDDQGGGFEMDSYRKPAGPNWEGGERRERGPRSPRGRSPSRSKSRERNGNRSRGGRISSPAPPVKVERSRSGEAPLPQRRDKFPRKEEKEEDGADYEWGGGKRKQPKREPGRGGESEESDGGGNNKDKEEEEPVEKEKPNFALSGKLTEEVNKVNGVVIKYAEPAESRKPKRRWRLYPFKGEQALPTLYIHRQSCYLIGRDRKVCDLPIDHPSCSKQHAALQYRLVPYEREDGTSGKRVRPYIIDLESANGTFVNNKKVDTKKYIELLEKDVLKFGFSSREYVLLHENSKEDEEDDDVVEDKPPAPAGGGGGGASNGGARGKRDQSE